MSLWILSADLGQVKDYTAIAAVRVTVGPIRSAHVGALERFRGESYPTVVTRIAAMAHAVQLRGCDVVLDGTGVGRAVVDMVRAALPGRKVWAITLTGGSKPSKGDHPHDLRVPKRDVITAAQVLLQEGRLKWPTELKLREQLESEFANYRLTISAALNETFDVGREGQHDDMLLAVAQACWLAKNLPEPWTDERVESLVLNEVAADVLADPSASNLERILAEHPHLRGD